MGKYTYIYDRYKSKKYGKRDGRGYRWIFWPFKKRETGVYPAPDKGNSITSFEQRLIAACKGDLKEIVVEWNSKDEILKKQFCELVNPMLNADRDSKKEEGDISGPRNALEQAAEDLKEVDFPSDWSHKVCLLIILLIGVVEFPLNSLVFQVFGENKTLTFIFAGIIALGVPLGTHVTGQFLKQRNKNSTMISWIIIIPMIFVGIMWGLSLVRAKVMGSTQSLLPQNERLSENESLYIFYGINIFLFAISTVISYLGSRKNLDEYNTANKRYQEAKRKLGKEDQEYINAKDRYNNLYRKWAGLRVKRQKLQAKYYHYVEIKISVFEHLIDLYRFWNDDSRARSNKPGGKYVEKAELRALPEIKIQDSLKDLEWNCSITDENELAWKKILEELNSHQLNHN